MINQLLRRLGNVFLTGTVRARLVSAAAVVIFVIGVVWLVYLAGGLQFSYAQLMYVPIVLGAITFGVPGGVLTAVAGGLALGPLMPLDTATGAAQDPASWAFRIAFFALVGALVGGWAQLFRRHTRQLEWLQEHHADSGMLNTVGFVNHLGAMLWRAERDQRMITVSLVQLDALPEIQDTFGPAFSSRVLAAVVERARGLVPPGSLVAVVQSDRLAIAMDAESADLERARLEGAVTESYTVDGLPLHIETSIGVAQFPTHARAADELLQRASIASQWAASRDALLSVYDATRDRTNRDNLVLLGAIPEAVERGEFEVWYQAKLDLTTDEITGAEALLRWRHGERGYVQPGSFIPQLEKTRLINLVTHTVIQKAFRAVGGWRAAGYPLLVSINLSVRNLLDRTLLEALDRNCRAHGLTPSDIELEITESAVMSDPQHCIGLIAELRDRGYGVAIDDFGVGHSSLSYLQKLRVSALKIDQEFVKTLATDANNQKIVRLILHLARSLGLSTVAEGVEDERALSLLREWGCDHAQGYFIHRPAPADQFALLLSQPHRSRALPA